MMSGATPMLGTPHSEDHDIPALRLRNAEISQRGVELTINVTERCAVCGVCLDDGHRYVHRSPPRSAREWRDLIDDLLGPDWVASFGQALSDYSADANNHLIHFVPRIDGNPRREAACGRWKILNRAYHVPLVNCEHCMRTHEFREAETRYLETKAAVAAMEDEDG